MRLASLLFLGTVLSAPASAYAQERPIVDASEPTDLSVTVYRDPYRSEGEELNADMPRGFGMISETRTVTLPPGESTIRFAGVAEGMVAVSAMVVGLPGGTIEKNRNAELLSPGALVNGALGNRVTITRTNPATGIPSSEQAIVRTRADGGLVLQTSAGFEAVRCAGLPEKLTFDGVPDGLFAMPTFSIDTRDETGGTYEVTLTYLSWGFDWQADYVANLTDKPSGDGFGMNWLSWLSLVNDNGQSFEDAELLVVAGSLNIESNFQQLADAPEPQALRLECYPLGNTKQGSAVQQFLGPVPPPPPPPPGYQTIVVTGARAQSDALESNAPLSVVTAGEENLGDLKLYRVPKRVTVSAKGMKQVAFLNRDDVQADFLYEAFCTPYTWFDPDGAPRPASLLLVTENETEKGLGVSLPQGKMMIFEPSSLGLQLAAETNLRDYARGQDVELSLTQSNQVQSACGRTVQDINPDETEGKWVRMQTTISNANPHPVTMRLNLVDSRSWEVRFKRSKTFVKNGYHAVELTIPANETLEFKWRLRSNQPK